MSSYSKYNTLRKDMVNKKVCGVCAGVARYFDLPVFGVRAATVVLGLMMPTTSVIAYLVAALVMPSRY
ncbi:MULTISPECIES: PspC domain-containing protein [unclassified Thalassotalea]|uniref:PspC domain-containing protein n=1 Tax=unclassified Thalassotalea TaxID=2614972 RepID=UPI001080C62E|nr:MULTISPECIES: PspC domain-containing protein [unclassified Thalassotalea]NMP17243.1 PspC domain-containing protein [Thalassotalea sp. Y01]QBY03831.1 PspC domain-containing protein [Thalassotalea sp. HSM 43]